MITKKDFDLVEENPEEFFNQTIDICDKQVQLIK